MIHDTYNSVRINTWEIARYYIRYAQMWCQLTSEGLNTYVSNFASQVRWKTNFNTATKIDCKDVNFITVYFQSIVEHQIIGYDEQHFFPLSDRYIQCIVNVPA